MATGDKGYIIDPLTCLCKLALLYYMPPLTKLGIGNYILHIQEYSYYQRIERFKNKDKKYDISNLNLPIVKAIKWYILDNPEKVEIDEQLSQSIRTIATFAIRGLRKLQTQTYHDDDTIRIVIQYFIKLLKDSLDNSWDEENLVTSIEHDNILSEKIKTNFEARTIFSIAKMLEDADKITELPDDVRALVRCSHELLKNRDAIFVKLMKDVNTTL